MTEPGIYQHFKGGRYRVLGVARHSETLEPMVVYLNAKGELWVRPEAMFNEMVNGAPRFTLIQRIDAHLILPEE